MRIVSHLAALLALLALGIALGDFASGPNILGGLAILVLFAALALALWRLYRDGGVAARRPAPSAAEPGGAVEAIEQETTVTAQRPPRPDRRRPLGAPDGSAWDAREADVARERRREERARRRGGKS